MKKLLVHLFPLIVMLGAIAIPPSDGRAAPNVAAAPSQTASFDYSMPDRFGRDDNGDGLIDYYVPTVHCVSGNGPCEDVPATSPLPISPSSWTVNLYACASEPG